MKTRIRSGSIASLCAAVIVLAWGLGAHAGQEVSQTRRTADFDRIALNGAFTTEITAGARAARVVVRGDRDTIARVTTTVEDRTLVVGMRPGTSVSDDEPKLAIAVPALTSFSNDGAGMVRITGLTGGNVEFRNAGAASIVAAGRARRETITLDGAGRIDAAGVDAHDVSVDNNGVGSVSVRASGALTMNVNGIGEIRYAGQPTSVESHVNGIGRIGRL